MPHGFRFWCLAAMRLPRDFSSYSVATNLMPLCGEAFFFDLVFTNLMPLCDEAFHFAFRLHLEHQRTQRLQDISGLYFIDASRLNNPFHHIKFRLNFHRTPPYKLPIRFYRNRFILMLNFNLGEMISDSSFVMNDFSSIDIRCRN